jgi:phosphate transport system substrate-binding protein
MAANGMKVKLNRFTLAGAIALATATVGLSVPAQSQSGPTVRVDGSSTVFPITEKAAEGFQKSPAANGAKVTVGISGTGGGFKKFCSGGTDISNASRPILQKEMDACAAAGVKYIEIPVAFDALTVVVNPRNTWATSMTPAELKKIWEPAAQGKITNWNQVNPSFPNKPLKLFGPGADSGTFDYFTEAINGKAKQSRSDFTGSEDDNVLVQGVSRDDGALGYFGYAYYSANKSRLKAVGIDNGKGPVMPSIETVLNGTYRPLSRPLFIYVNAESAKRPEVKAFINYFMDNGEAITKQVAYVPMPAKGYDKMQERFAKGKTGTAFGGKEPTGLTVDQLVASEPK